MAKRQRKSKKKRTQQRAAAPVKQRPSPQKVAIAAGLALALAAGGGWWWWRGAQADAAFMAHAARGQAALALVEFPASEGTGHVQSGGRVAYRNDPPTSGSHDPRWTNPGFYRGPQRPENLVHALEHGNVVVYYDRPGADALATLEQWAGLHDLMWSGIVVTPKPGLGEGIVLTAWRKLLRLDRFDAAAAAAFIDAYRGRGPENPVR